MVVYARENKTCLHFKPEWKLMLRNPDKPTALGYLRPVA